MATDEIQQFYAVFPCLSYSDKLLCITTLIRFVREEEDRRLLKETLKIVERAYHPMERIEAWMEKKLTKNVAMTPKQVIFECRCYLKLRKGVEPLLWPIARKVKKRVKRKLRKEGR